MRKILLPLTVVTLFLLAWLPRGLGLDIFVTPDEPLWLTRSANFYRAWSVGNLAETYQREHPGVTIMLAGTLALLRHLPEYPALASGAYNPDTPALTEWLTAQGRISALELLTAARGWVALWIALAFALAFLPARRLLGSGFALFALLWAAFDPFHVALSRQLHQDGLLAALLLLAFLALLAYAENGRRIGWLLLSALAMGLAWLTRAPSGILLPFGILLLVIYGWRGDWGWRAIAGASVLWGGAAALISIVLWPALWVAPVESLRQMLTVLLYYAGEGHGNGVFFLGEVTDIPGAWYYPVVYLFRATPFTLAGLLLAGWAAWHTRTRAESAVERRVMLVCLLFALYFLLFMGSGAKQQERYILTTFLMLDVVAAWGWWVLARALAVWQPRRALGMALLGAALAAQLLSTLAEYPYYFTYYNPLMGGRAAAEQTLTIGWGEGMEQAAHWLNARGGDPPTVLSWYDHGSLSYFLNGRARSITEEWSPTVWCDTDYIVTYINQWQRRLPSPEADAYLATLTPAERIYSAGLEYARIYDLAGARLPDFPAPNDDARADFGAQIRLTTIDLSSREARAGESLLLTLNLQSLRVMDADYNVLVKLVAPDGRELWRGEGYPWGAPTSDWEPCAPRPDGHTITIPADTPPGEYALTIEFYNPADFAPLPVTEVNRPDAPLSDRAWTVALIAVGE